MPIRERDLGQLGRAQRAPARFGPERPESVRRVVDQWHPDPRCEIGDVERVGEWHANVATAGALGLELPARALLEFGRRPIEAIEDHGTSLPLT